MRGFPPAASFWLYDASLTRVLPATIRTGARTTTQTVACYDVSGRPVGKETDEVDTGTAFGDLLRRRRDATGLTQEDLARLTDLTPQAISLLERGERRRPHRYTVQKLAEALALEGRDLTEFESASRSGAPPISRRRDARSARRR